MVIIIANKKRNKFFILKDKEFFIFSFEKKKENKSDNLKKLIEK
jgi:hypothetical protein